MISRKSRFQLLREIIETFNVAAITDGEKFTSTESLITAYEKLSGNRLSSERLKRICTKRWYYKELQRRRGATLDRLHNRMKQLRYESIAVSKFKQS